MTDVQDNRIREEFGFPFNYISYPLILVIRGRQSVFHRFRQAKFAYGGLLLSPSQYLLLPKQPLKTMLTIKVVKIDLKIIISQS